MPDEEVSAPKDQAAGAEGKYVPSDRMCKQIDVAFTYHAPKSDQPQRYVAIRNMGGMMAAALATACPESRELSLAMTKLEEAVMWANASIARNE